LAAASMRRVQAGLMRRSRFLPRFCRTIQRMSGSSRRPSVRIACGRARNRRPAPRSRHSPAPGRSTGMAHSFGRSPAEADGWPGRAGGTAAARVRGPESRRGSQTAATAARCSSKDRGSSCPSRAGVPGASASPQDCRAMATDSRTRQRGRWQVTQTGRRRLQVAGGEQAAIARTPAHDEERFGCILRSLLGRELGVAVEAPTVSSAAAAAASSRLPGGPGSRCGAQIGVEVTRAAQRAAIVIDPAHAGRVPDSPGRRW